MRNVLNTLRVLEEVASRQPIGVVCGSGFEDRPQLLARTAGTGPERPRSGGNACARAAPTAAISGRSAPSPPGGSGRPSG